MEFLPDADPAFGLRDCETDNTNQSFVYDVATQAISPATDTKFCVVVAPESRQAGPFMSRSLLMAECGATDATLREWTILDG